jgi:hypothetical protein
MKLLIGRMWLVHCPVRSFGFGAAMHRLCRRWARIAWGIPGCRWNRRRLRAGLDFLRQPARPRRRHQPSFAAPTPGIELAPAAIAEAAKSLSVKLADIAVRLGGIERVLREFD